MGATSTWSRHVIVQRTDYRGYVGSPKGAA